MECSRQQAIFLQLLLLSIAANLLLTFSRHVDVAWLPRRQGGTLHHRATIQLIRECSD